MDIDKKIRSEYNRRYREKHKEHIKELNRQYRENNKDKIKEYREKNKEMLREYSKIYHKQYRERMPEYKNRQNKITRIRFSKTKYAPKHMQPWTAEEEKMVLNPNMTLYDLALKLGRSEQAINLKRVKLRKCGISTSTLKEVIDNE